MKKFNSVFELENYIETEAQKRVTKIKNGGYSGK